MNLINLFSLSYWFVLIPGPLQQKGKIFFISLIIILLLGAITSLYYKKNVSLFKKTFSRLYTFFSSNLVVAFVFLFLRYEIVPFLAARFWLALWFIIMAIWLYFILKSVKGISEKRKEEIARREKEKYIP